MKTALAWIVGLSVSVGAHAALAAFLMLGSEPDPLNSDPHPSGQIKMEAYEVSETRAEAQENRGEDAEAEDADGENLNQGAIRTDRADALPLSGDIAAAQTPESNRQQAQEPDAQRPEVIKPPSDVVAPTEGADTVIAADQISGAETPALFAQGAVVAASSLPADDAAVVAAEADAIQAEQVRQPAQQSVAAKAATLAPALVPQSGAVAAKQPQGIVLASATAPSDTLLPNAPRAGPVAASPVIGENTGQISPDGPLAEAVAPPSSPVAQTNSNDAAVQVASAIPETDSLLAVTSFAGNGGAPFDAVSLAAVTSFMRPSDTSDNADSARDGISQLLAQIPCARVAATFIPETGELELRGHIPDGDLRGPVIDAIQAQLGTSIPVSGSMLVLPEPQCNVLSDFEGMDLPQSTDQVNDSTVVGASVQAAVARLAEGSNISLTVEASEFPAYFYIDFYQIDGQVIHIVPNEAEPLELLQISEIREIGENPDEGFYGIVQPPFGTELVVIYSSSVPLFDELRDIIEPAQPYLEALKERIAIAREANEDFKGEWVYMLIETHGLLN